MINIDDNVPIKLSNRELALSKAKKLFYSGIYNKQQSAKLAVEEFGVWNGISYQSAIDYIRQRLDAENIHRK